MIRRGRLPAIAVISLGAVVAHADELVALRDGESRGTLEFEYRLASPAHGAATLVLDWTDSNGRLLDHQQLQRNVATGVSIVLSLDRRRALAAGNRLQVAIDMIADGSPAHYRASAETSFATPRSSAPWRDYHVIAWQTLDAAGERGLRAIGIDAGAAIADRDDAHGNPVGPAAGNLLDAGLRCYFENVATDFFSPYHRWAPGHPVNWQFTAVQDAYKRDPLDETAFVREPSLADPAWLSRISERFRRVVHGGAQYQPLFYDLGDETGIADLSAFWDFDFSPESLDGMRRWLQTQYASLDQLNGEWSTSFSRWSEVRPLTTTQALGRTDGNYAAWSDFKAWMDISFAHALATVTDAAHGADPSAIIGIEGGQAPGWGGYDYSNLAHAVDLMELYDVGENLEIARAFNPNLIFLMTSFGTGPEEIHRLWHSALRGDRGVILWDAKGDLVGQDGAIGPRGRALEPFFTEIKGGIGDLLIASRRRADPVAILYSPESQRIHWILDRRRSGRPWNEGSGASDPVEDPVRDATGAFIRLFGHLGIHPTFVTASAIEAGGLGSVRTLVLPQSVALSEAVAVQIEQFVAGGGRLVVDGRAGEFDGHGRKLSQVLPILRPSARDGFDPVEHGLGAIVYLNGADEISMRLDTPADRQHWSDFVLGAGSRAKAIAIGADGNPAVDVTTYAYDIDGGTMLAIERDADAQGAEPVTLRLPHQGFLYQPADGRFLGSAAAVDLRISAAKPVILVMADHPAVAPAVRAPAQARLGELVSLHLASGDHQRALVAIKVTRPDGQLMRDFSRTCRLTADGFDILLPFALNDPPGRWVAHLRDVATGLEASAAIEVLPRS